MQSLPARLWKWRLRAAGLTLGVDYAAGRWPGGLMVKHSLGEGSYAGDGGSGTVESALTGVYPYAAVDLSEPLRA